MKSHSPQILGLGFANFSIDFKPSTDLKAIELLKIFVSHRNAEALRDGVSAPTSFLAAPGKPESVPEACIIMNAEWVLPWMWRRRNTDLEFVILMTSVWMFALWEEREVLMDEHPMFKVMVKHHIVLEVFNVSYRSGQIDQTADYSMVRTSLGICFHTTLSSAWELLKKP